MNGKIPSVIRWTRSDYAKLSNAVRRFNKKISELEALEKDYLPEQYNYSELRDTIYSRRELNRIIRGLNRFTTKESQQQMIVLPSGEEISRWEYNELKKAMRRSIERITKEMINIAETHNIIGNQRMYELQRTKESIRDLFNRSGFEFRRTAGRTEIWGKTDYELWRAEIFRENYMNSLKEMSNYENYKLLYNKLKSIENPIQFYNYVKQSNILMDLFLFYKDKATAQTYGGFVDNQEAFNTALKDELGIVIHE